MNMVTCNAVIEEGNLKLVYVLPQTVPIFNSIDSTAQKELAIMTTVGQVIGVTRQDTAIGTRHRNTSIVEDTY